MPISFVRRALPYESRKVRSPPAAARHAEGHREARQQAVLHHPVVDDLAERATVTGRSGSSARTARRTLAITLDASLITHTRVLDG
jgi:hypothetical protein